MNFFSLVLVFLQMKTTAAQFDRSGCGNLKGCLTYPNGCQATGTCRMYFSYLNWASNFRPLMRISPRVNNFCHGNDDFIRVLADSEDQVDGDALAMEIFGQFDQSRQPAIYYAVGFSDDQAMGDDTVVYCRSSQGATQSGLAYNSGRSNTIMNPQNIQVPTQSSSANGSIYCAFRQKIMSVTQNVKNLENAFYILVATGTPNTQDGGLSYHNQDKTILGRTDLRQYYRSGGRVMVIPIMGTPVEPFQMQRPLKDWLKIIHAILMAVSWAIFLSTGILFARHFKNHWPESTMCGVKLWFAYHRTLNSLGILISTAGVVAIFWAFDWSWMGPQPGWSMEENLNSGTIHCALGAIAFVIMWIQPFNALCRCKPDGGARWLFNWIHRLIGMTGFLCAMAAITIAAFNFNTLFLDWDAAQCIWIAFLAIFIITEVILEVLKIKRWCSSSTVIIPEKEKESGGAASNAPVSGFSNAQSYVLLFFFILAFVLVAAFSVLIFLKPVKY